MKKNLKNKEPNYREEKANKMILDKKEYFIQNNNDDKKGKNSNNIKLNIEKIVIIIKSIKK